MLLAAGLQQATAAETKAVIKLDLNKATPAELEKLPGIGPALSKKIVAGRPYKSVDDLKKAGISATEIRKINSLVTVGPAIRSFANQRRQAPQQNRKAGTCRLEQGDHKATGRTARRRVGLREKNHGCPAVQNRRRPLQSRHPLGNGSQNQVARHRRRREANLHGRETNRHRHQVARNRSEHGQGIRRSKKSPASAAPTRRKSSPAGRINRSTTW